MVAAPYIDVAEFKAQELRGAAPHAAGGASATEVADIADLNLERALDRTIERVVRTAMEKHDGNVSRAAKAIGVSRGKIYDLMERIGLRPRSRDDDAGAASAK
jgi:DNA-binding NtrC family response regulator